MLAHPNETEIVQTEISKDLYSLEGGLLFSFPKDMPDEHIRQSLCFANNTYAIGFESGKARIQAEIRHLLGI